MASLKQHTGGGGRVGSFLRSESLNSGIIWDYSVTSAESKDAIYHDSWTIEEGEHVTKLIRHHKFPRSRKFIPTEAESVPIDPFRLLDKRVTIMRSLSIS